jgi:hypothetical protein
MSSTERCDEILRLIDEALADAERVGSTHREPRCRDSR